MVFGLFKKDPFEIYHEERKNFHKTYIPTSLLISSSDFWNRIEQLEKNQDIEGLIELSRLEDVQLRHHVINILLHWEKNDHDPRIIECIWNMIKYDENTHVAEEIISDIRHSKQKSFLPYFKEFFNTYYKLYWDSDYRLKDKLDRWRNDGFVVDFKRFLSEIKNAIETLEES